MRVYNRYILWLAGLFILTTVVLSAYGQTHLDVYLSLYLIESLALSLLYVHLNPQARRGLNLVGYVLFAAFIGIVVVKVMEILF